jgi:O-antigen/teichoic acid export membrane protein
MSNSSNRTQAIWLGLSSLSSILVSIVSAAILSRYFNKSEYGTYKQIMFVYVTLSTIFQAGLPLVFSYFLPKYSHSSGKYIVNKINGLLMLFGLLFSITIFSLSSFIANLLNNPELTFGLKIFSIFPLFTLPTLGLEGIYIVNKNTRFLAIYNTLTRFLMLGCIVLPVIFIKNSYITAIIGWGVASFITFLFAIHYKAKPYHDVKGIEKVPHLLRSVLRYSLPLMGSSCVLLLFNSVNQFVISKYFGVEAFADYSNGFVPLPFVSLLIGPIRNLIIPMVSKSTINNDFGEPINFFNSSISKVAVIIIPLIVFCAFYAKEIVTFLYGEIYTSSAVFFIINLCFNLSELFAFQVFLTGLGKTKALMIFDIVFTWILILVNAVLIYMNLSSPVIVAIVFTICQIVLRSIVPYIYLTRKIGLSIITKKTISQIIIISLHSLLVCMVTVIVYSLLGYQLPIIFNLIVSAFIFYVLLELSGRIKRFSYISSIYKSLK